MSLVRWAFRPLNWDFTSGMVARWSITVLRSVSSSVSASARWRRARGAVLAGPAPAISGARHQPSRSFAGW